LEQAKEEIQNLHVKLANLEIQKETNESTIEHLKQNLKDAKEGIF
jgi:predicted  nucleic acid-binding Zn-ribbon protein